MGTRAQNIENWFPKMLSGSKLNKNWEPEKTPFDLVSYFFSSQVPNKNRRNKKRVNTYIYKRKVEKIGNLGTKAKFTLHLLPLTL